MALILVVGVAAVVALMAGHIAVTSETLAREAHTAATRTRLRYVAESASERAFWLLLADRARFGNRALGRSALDRGPDEQEAWMMDGRQHELTVDEFTVQVVIRDADTGLDVSGPNAAQALREALRSDDVERQQVVDRFLDVLADYIDADDAKRLYGKEVDDYRAEGHPDLPRNAPLQRREEVFWIDGLAAVLAQTGDLARVGQMDADTVRLIPPPGLQFPAARRGPGGTTASGRPAFFSATPYLIRSVGRFTDDEMRQVLEARAEWQAEGRVLDESLAPELMARLRSLFSFDESGIATVVATARSADGQVVRTLRVTRDCRPGPSAFADPTRTLLCIWERVVH